MVRVRDVADFQPCLDFLIQFRANRDVSVRARGFGLSEPIAPLLGLLQCLVNSQQTRLHIIQSQGEQFAWSEAADTKNPRDQMLTDRYSRGSRE